MTAKKKVPKFEVTTKFSGQVRVDAAKGDLLTVEALEALFAAARSMGADGATDVRCESGLGAFGAVVNGWARVEIPAGPAKQATA